MIKPIRIRFDDVITTSTNPKIKGKELQKFLKHIRWCSNIEIPLSLAILCQDTEKIPGAIEALQELIKKGVVEADLHGWTHEDYAVKSEKEIKEDFDKALIWFDQNLGVRPKRFVTPHGGYSENIQSVSDEYGLIVETTQPPVVDIRVLEPLIRRIRDLKIIQSQVIMVHWFEMGLRPWRLARIIEHQSIEKAIEATKNELGKKEHRIIWKGWRDINV